jgi:hypothetical protein
MADASMPSEPGRSGRETCIVKRAMTERYPLTVSDR